MKKTIYELKWNVLLAAEMVLKLPANMPTPKALLTRIYTGNGTRLIHTAIPRLWAVTTTTRAKANDGTIHTLKTTFKPNAAMFVGDLTRHITPQWIAYCDEDLKDMDVIDALAVARCLI